VTSLIAQHESESREVKHWWYNTWPDHGVPKIDKKHPTSHFLNMLDDMDVDMLEEERFNVGVKDTAPVLVHCSAGVGRTGTIVTLSHCRRLLQLEGEVLRLAFWIYGSLWPSLTKGRRP
jgi:protein tyrosine phosphatase